MFDPSVGRWFQEDPEGFTPGDPNLFRYVKNNPTNATDPSGLQQNLSISSSQFLTTGQTRDLDRSYAVLLPFGDLADHTRNLLLNGDRGRKQLLNDYDITIPPYKQLGLQTFTNKEVKRPDKSIAKAETVKIALNFFALQWFVTDPDDKLGIRITEIVEHYLQQPSEPDVDRKETVRNELMTPKNGNAWRKSPLDRRVARESGYTHGIVYVDTPAVIVFLKEGDLTNADGKSKRRIEPYGTRSIGFQKIEIIDKTNPRIVYDTVYLHFTIGIKTDGEVIARANIVSKDAYDDFNEHGHREMPPPRAPFAPEMPPLPKPIEPKGPRPMVDPMKPPESGTCK